MLLLLAILVTIGTAWFSVNHFISGYIRTQATQNINEQITLVRRNWRVTSTRRCCWPPTSTSGDQRQEGAAGDRLSQHRQAHWRHGIRRERVIDDKARVDALRKLIPAANNQITVSPLEQLDGKPVISILVPRGADSAYLYYLDMSEFKTLLTKVSGRALLLPHRQSGTGALQQQAPGREREPPQQAGYSRQRVDPDRLCGSRLYPGHDPGAQRQDHPLALLGVAALVLALSMVALNLAYRPILPCATWCRSSPRAMGI